MITFTDLPNHLRITRVETGTFGTVLTPLGRISKATFIIDSAMREQFLGDELAEVERIVSGYSHASSERRRLYSLDLPVILREVMDHFEGAATETERSFVACALVEAGRRLRRFQRDV